MIKKYTDTNSSYSTSYDAFDIKEYQGQKSNVNRFDYDLYDDSKNVIEAVFRVKHSATPKRGEKWKVLKNEEVVVEIDGAKLLKKEREFLRSIDGIKWLIEKSKNEMNSIKNISKIKQSLKKVIIKKI